MLQSWIDEKIEIITHNLQQSLHKKEKEKHKFAILNIVMTFAINWLQGMYHST